MAMDFSKVKSINIPEGSVSKITISNKIVWQKDTGGLPSEYQQIDYIYAPSQNGAYIDLGIQYAHGCTFEIGWVYTHSNIQIFGATDTAGSHRCLLTAHCSDSAGNWYYGTYNNQFLNIAYPPNDTTIGKLIKQKAVYKSGDNQGYIEDLDTGEKTSFTIQDYTVPNNLYLLGQNYKGNYRGSGLKQISYFKYWDNNENLLRDMIPCYRKSDNVIGMYDKVSNTFFTNAGTGTFYKEIPANTSDEMVDDIDII